MKWWGETLRRLLPLHPWTLGHPRPVDHLPGLQLRNLQPISITCSHYSSHSWVHWGQSCGIWNASSECCGSWPFEGQCCRHQCQSHAAPGHWTRPKGWRKWSLAHGWGETFEVRSTFPRLFDLFYRIDAGDCQGHGGRDAHGGRSDTRGTCQTWTFRPILASLLGFKRKLCVGQVSWLVGPTTILESIFGIAWLEAFSLHVSILNHVHYSGGDMVSGYFTAWKWLRSRPLSCSWTCTPTDSRLRLLECALAVRVSLQHPTDLQLSYCLRLCPAMPGFWYCSSFGPFSIYVFLKHAFCFLFIFAD